MPKNNTLAVALAALLVGGVATAGYMNSRNNDSITAPSLTGGAARAEVDYAEVVGVKPVTEREPMYATVIGSEPIREIQHHQHAARGLRGRGGAGAPAGTRRQRRRHRGRCGHRWPGRQPGRWRQRPQAGHGGGRGGRRLSPAVRSTAATSVARWSTAPTAAAAPSTTPRPVPGTVAWNVTYRNPDGTTGSMRTEAKPGERIALGDAEKTVGYDVTYRWDGQQRTVRMDQDPGTAAAGDRWTGGDPDGGGGRRDAALIDIASACSTLAGPERSGPACAWWPQSGDAGETHGFCGKPVVTPARDWRIVGTDCAACAITMAVRPIRP